jgi:ATP-dependent 26S proteasome regulatory subunit
MQEELSILIRAQYPLIYLVTYEEERAEHAIARIVRQERQAVTQTKLPPPTPPSQVDTPTAEIAPTPPEHSQQNPSAPQQSATQQPTATQPEFSPPLFCWTETRGFVDYPRAHHPRGNGAMGSNTTLAPQAAIDWMLRRPGAGTYIFKDLHPFLENPTVIRCLRDAVAQFKGTESTIILISPIQQIPIELQTEVVVLDFTLPNLNELDRVLSKQLRQSGPRILPAQAREKLLKAALGLTQDEAEKVYRKAQVMRGRLTEAEVEVVLSEKKQLIRRNGILDYIEEDETLDSVGGLEELKHWLRQRSNAFSESARQYGLPQPKGMLILGVPGCGKSLIAKTTARLWHLPLLRLDMGRVYDGSTVGRSEANLRNALKTAESISPAILFIDELDKAFAGSAGSADSDGGTSSRIFGSFLTWMQEKTLPVFVMATANRIDRLPGEFLRKGRFDEIFFVDLPTPEERTEIFRIHITKRRREVDRFDLQQLAKISDGFSGAEIEQALISAMYEAFAQGREFTQLDIIAAVKATLPLSRTLGEQVAALRDWARQRARPAASSIAEYQRLEF